MVLSAILTLSGWTGGFLQPGPVYYQVPRPGVTAEVREHVPLSRVTYYHAVPAQTDPDPETSACGPTTPGQIAVSRDLFRSAFACGEEVLLCVDGHGCQLAVVWDTMHRRFTHTADLLVPDGERAPFGRATGHLARR